MIPVKLPRDQKDQLIGRVQHYFSEERDEAIGDLAAEMLLDFMIRELAPHIYNQAVEDAARLARERMAALDEDLYAMKKPLKPGR